VRINTSLQQEQQKHIARQSPYTRTIAHRFDGENTQSSALTSVVRTMRIPASGSGKSDPKKFHPQWKNFCFRKVSLHPVGAAYRFSIYEVFEKQCALKAYR
jgi:hypothetical protein